VTPGPSIERLARMLSGAPLTSTDREALHEEECWQLAERHGVAGLVASRLAAVHGLDRHLAERVIELTRQQVTVDMAHEAQLRCGLTSLHGAGVDAVVMKGAQLAYSHYERPDLRPRLDTDLMISAAQRALAHEVLVGGGYSPDVQASADLVLHQQTYVKPIGHGLGHVIDLHWRLANPEIFGTVLTFEEMAREAVGIAALGGEARGLSPVHALLVACIHRVAHHRGAERLIWLLDIHLLASRFDDSEWSAFVSLAAERGVAAVCADGLERTQQLFGTRLPECVRELANAHAEGRREATARYLAPLRVVSAVLDDLRFLPTWHHRWRLVKDYAFPPVRYMREVYAPASASPLAWLYVRRMVFGARRWLAQS
jgi:putative nucleotidyltransferase-like protein